MATKRISDIDRFFKHIRILVNGCWEWQRAKDWDGYGLFKVYPVMVRAHRWIYEQQIGPIPEGLQIDHLCRNRACVNPEHLEPVTGLVNTQRGWRANKTQCKHGHSLSGENLYVGPDGKRACKICRKRWVQAYGKRTNWAAQRAYKLRRAGG